MQKKEGRKKIFYFILFFCLQRMSLGHSAAAGRRSLVAGRGNGFPTIKLCPFLLKKYILKFIFLEVQGMGQAFWENGCTTPHFLKLAPILGSVKSSIPHGAWRFHFYSIFFPKIRGHMDLHIYHWNVSFMEK